MACSAERLAALASSCACSSAAWLLPPLPPTTADTSALLVVDRAELGGEDSSPNTDTELRREVG